MNTIWKYDLEVTDEQMIEMPERAIPLTVQVQFGKPCLWVRVDPTAPTIKRKIITHGTGHDVPPTTGEYIDTYQLQGGAFIGHVFEGG